MCCISFYFFSTFPVFHDTKQNLTSIHPDLDLLTVMTYNVRWADLNNLEDRGPHSWFVRRQRVASVITSYLPDIIGTQENLVDQHRDLMRLIGPKFGSVGRSKVAILYNKEKLVLAEHGEFLFDPSDQPDRSRYATWAKFRGFGKSHPKEEILVVNTHQNALYENRRRKGAKVLVDEIVTLSQNGKLPVLVTGDFNACPGQFTHSYLTDSGLADTWEECEKLGCCNHGMESTYHHFMGAKINEIFWKLMQYIIFTIHGVLNLPNWNRYHIDWILFKNPVDTQKLPHIVPHFISVVLEPGDYLGEISSDHFPVVAIFSLQHDSS